MNLNGWCFLKGFIGSVIGSGLGLFAIKLWNSVETTRRVNEFTTVIIVAAVFFFLFFLWGDFLIGGILDVMGGRVSALVDKNTGNREGQENERE
jgi:hypothetical protein